jgi:hypothetical protein
MRHELQIQFTGLALEPLEPLLAESSGIRLHALVDVLVAKFEPAVDQTGKFVGHGGDGFGRAQAGSKAPIVGAQGPLTVPQIVRGQAQGIGGAVDDRTGPTCEHFAPADPGVGTSSEPRGAVLFGLPPAHIQADLRAAGVSGEDLEAIDAGQVHTAAAVELGGQIKLRLVAAGFLGPTRRGGQRVVWDLDLAVNGVEVCVKPDVALGNLLLVTFIACQ